MRKVVIDINVIMDLSLKREGFKAAEKILDICIKKDVEGFLCSHEITTLAYLLQKSFDLSKVEFFLKEILDIFTVLPSNNEILLLALDSDVRDYEDAVIEISSLENGIDYIITNNLKDFKDSKVKAISPEEFILLQNKD